MLECMLHLFVEIIRWNEMQYVSQFLHLYHTIWFVIFPPLHFRNDSIYHLCNWDSVSLALSIAYQRLTNKLLLQITQRFRIDSVKPWSNAENACRYACKLTCTKINCANINILTHNNRPINWIDTILDRYRCLIFSITNSNNHHHTTDQTN